MSETNREFSFSVGDNIFRFDMVCEINNNNNPHIYVYISKLVHCDVAVTLFINMRYCQIHKTESTAEVCVNQYVNLYCSDPQIIVIVFKISKQSINMVELYGLE